jgi:hypothetical protein
VRQRPLRQLRPSQQASLDVHDSISRLHAQVPVVPPSAMLQRAPPQQSRVPMQTSLRRRHEQVPVLCPEAMLQSICPQQSSEVVHEPIAGWQQSVPEGSAPQE